MAKVTQILQPQRSSYPQRYDPVVVVEQLVGVFAAPQAGEALVEGSITDDTMHFRMQSRGDGEEIGRRDGWKGVIHVAGRRAFILEPLYDRRQSAFQVVEAESVDGDQQHQRVLGNGTGHAEHHRETDEERAGDHLLSRVYESQK